MGILSKLGWGPKETVGAVTGAAKDVADIVERWNPSDKAKHDMARENVADAAKNVQEARSYEPKSELSGAGLFASIVNSINVLVDAANRLVRPTLAFTLMGTLFSWWEVELNTDNPLMVSMAMAVFGFYFGVRGLTEDMPKILRAIREFKNAKRD